VVPRQRVPARTRVTRTPVFYRGCRRRLGPGPVAVADRARTGPLWVAEPYACTWYLPSTGTRREFLRAIGWPLPRYSLDREGRIHALSRNAALPRRAATTSGVRGRVGCSRPPCISACPSRGPPSGAKALIRDGDPGPTATTSSHAKSSPCIGRDDVRKFWFFSQNPGPSWDGLMRSRGIFEATISRPLCGRVRSVLDWRRDGGPGIPVNPGLAERFNR